MSRLAVLVAVAVAVVVAVKPLLVAPGVLLSPVTVSDEVYYVPAGRFLVSRLLGLNYTPPYEVVVTAGESGTIHVNVTVHDPGVLPVNLLAVVDWRNLEHPAFAKLVYGAVLEATGGSIVSLRVALLLFSAVAYGLLAYVLVSRWRLLGVVGLAVFLIVDRLFVYFTFLVFLDTLMMAFFAVGLSLYLLGRRRGGLLALSLSAACKAPALALIVPFAIAERRRSGLWGALAFIVAPALALLASYGLNLVFASPQELARAVLGVARIRDWACFTPVCFFAMSEQWGLMELHPPMLWLWLLLPVLLALSGRRDVGEEYLPLFIALFNILFVTVVSLSRAVYVYYYLPAVSLTPYAVAYVADTVLAGVKRLEGYKARVCRILQELKVNRVRDHAAAEAH